jgi:L-threonylcarbamoyladenylate synthase
VKRVVCDAAGLEETARILLAGGVAVVPTDTVYGVAAHPGFPAAVARLYEIKGRDRSKPIALLASGADAVAAFGFPLSGMAADLAAAHWPGALTLVVDNGATTEGFRVPAHEWTRRLIAACGGVLRVTSANASGAADAADAASAVDSLASAGGSADIVADGGLSPGGVASTVLRVSTSGGISVLRPGPVHVPASR